MVNNLPVPGGLVRTNPIKSSARMIPKLRAMSMAAPPLLSSRPEKILPVGQKLLLVGQRSSRRTAPCPPGKEKIQAGDGFAFSLHGRAFARRNRFFESPKHRQNPKHCQNVKYRQSRPARCSAQSTIDGEGSSGGSFGNRKS